MKDVTELRLQLGMTIRKFAIFIGIPLRTMNNYVYGESKMPDYSLAMLNELVDQLSKESTKNNIWVISSGKDFSEGVDDNVFLTKHAAIFYGITRRTTNCFSVGCRRASYITTPKIKLIANPQSKITKIEKIDIESEK